MDGSDRRAGSPRDRVEQWENHVRALIASGLTVVYATCYVAITAGLAYAPPLAFAGWRLVIAGAALLGFVAALRRPLAPARRLWPWILLLALAATTAAYGAMFASPGRAGAGIASVLGNLQPMFVVGLAALVLGERMSRADWATLALGVLGAVAIAWPTFRGSGTEGLAGPALALSASLGFAVGSVIIKRMEPGTELLSVTGWQLLAGGLPLLAAAALLERGAPVRWTAEFVGLLLFLALPGTALATAVWYWLVQRGDVGRLSMVFFLVPIFALGLAAAVYDEPLGGAEALGVALIFVGIGVALAQAWRGKRGSRDRARCVETEPSAAP
jgi:drug/metabolite transporter (DMT)-like permease